jgi:hypothetical protein
MNATIPMVTALYAAILGLRRAYGQRDRQPRPHRVDAGDGDIVGLAQAIRAQEISSSRRRSR